MDFAMIINVLACRLPEVESKLQKLARKAKRYGNVNITWTVGESFVKTVVIRRNNKEVKLETTYVPIDFVGSAPKINGYTLLAELEPHEEGIVVQPMGKPEAVEKRFWDTDMHCDHCNSNRNRSSVFVLRNDETGDQMQVGRTCLRDFLGVDDPAYVLAQAEFERVAANMGDDVTGSGSFGGPFYNVKEVLTIGAVFVRLHGWVSIAAVRNNENMFSTADRVSFSLTNSDEARKQYQEYLDNVTAADVDAVERLVDEVRNSVPENDYEHNLKVLLVNTEVSSRNFSTVISVLSRIFRKKGSEGQTVEEEKVSDWVGEVGKRVRNVTVKVAAKISMGESQWGETFLVKMVTSDGAQLAWFTGNPKGFDVDNDVVVDFTVKSHDEYRGTKQTKITRCKIA